VADENRIDAPKIGDVDPRAWMAGLPDGASLFDVTLPGTHDTCALHGGEGPRTQTRILAEQLESGVRFLDIRCRHERDVFNVYHGIVDQHVEYGEGVQQVCLDFLQAHPSETIVMSVKKEGDGGGNARTFEQVFRGYIERAGCAAQWLLADAAARLSQARGRIVLFRRFDADQPGATLGLKPLPWPENTIFEVEGVASFRIQDAWRIPTIADRAVKWDRVEALLDEARQGEPKLFVNFCSGTGAGSRPHIMADYINPRLTHYLTRNPKGRFGWLLVDFETTELNRLIFETNFQR
jgi:1-phosphatidylinositol phosphodiesterase